ncbi:MAG: MerR family transcriptional regulator [Pseudomonadota bacterium]
MPSNSRDELPPIPAKRYFTIGEVSELCGVKPHVLRYWEQEFTQLRPVKRRGNRRYYQHHEVLLARRIRELLYQDGFTINGARHRLDDPSALKLNGQNAPMNTPVDVSLEVQSAAQLGLQFDMQTSSLRKEITAIIDFLRADGLK